MVESERFRIWLADVLRSTQFSKGLQAVIRVPSSKFEYSLGFICWRLKEKANEISILPGTVFQLGD